MKILKRLSRIITMLIFVLFLGVLCACSILSVAEAKGFPRCDNITLEDGAAILVVAVSDLQKSSSDLLISPDDIERQIYKAPPYKCTMRSKTNFLKSLSYIIYVYNNSEQARTEFNKMKESFATVAKVDQISEFGDETFRVEDSRFQRMVCIKGDLVLDILNPKESNLQKQIVRLVLKTL